MVEQVEKKKRTQMEYSRILSAAVINNRFRGMLLDNPEEAIARGYSGEQFEIDGEEQKHLSAIQANTLADFAAQMAVI